MPTAMFTVSQLIINRSSFPFQQQQKKKTEKMSELNARLARQADELEESRTALAREKGHSIRLSHELENKVRDN